MAVWRPIRSATWAMAFAAILGPAQLVVGEATGVTAGRTDYWGDAAEVWRLNFAGMLWSGLLAAAVPPLVLLARQPHASRSDADGESRAFRAGAAAGQHTVPSSLRARWIVMAALGACTGLPVAALLAAAGRHLPVDTAAPLAGIQAYGIGLLCGAGISALVAGTALGRRPVPSGLLAGFAASWLTMMVAALAHGRRPVVPGGVPIVQILATRSIAANLLISTGLWYVAMAALYALWLRRRATSVTSVVVAASGSLAALGVVLLLAARFGLPGSAVAPLADWRCVAASIAEAALVTAVIGLTARARHRVPPPARLATG